MHIYAFGSICRGDVSPDSDVDLLSLVNGPEASHFNPDVYSVYTYERVRELWAEGNPFAWHLWLESRLLFASDGVDYLQSQGAPAAYSNVLPDCFKFLTLFNEACASLTMPGCTSTAFELSTIFLSIRNIATCFSLGSKASPVFSRDSARRLGENSILLEDDVFMACWKEPGCSVQGVAGRLRGTRT